VLIDWFTIVAQIINFLILLFLLRRFLYRPILNAMDERERVITLRQREAQELKQVAEKEGEEYRRLTADLHARREGLFSQAEAEAEEQRKNMLRQARVEVDHLQASWYRAIEQEKEALLHELSLNAGRQTLAIARRALEDLADRELEEQIVEVFLRRLKDLESGQKQQMTGPAGKPHDNLRVRSSFPLSPEQTARVEHAVRDYLGYSRSLEFEADSDLVCGIELRSTGHKISWSLSSYLDELQEGIFEAFRERKLDHSMEAGKPG
jgi:F-type H+-transporting ATPase subunit b